MEKFQNLPEKYTESTPSFTTQWVMLMYLLTSCDKTLCGALEAHIVKVDQFIEYKWSSN